MNLNTFPCKRKSWYKLYWLAGLFLLMNHSLSAQNDTVKTETYDTLSTGEQTDETKTIIDVAPVETVDEEEADAEFLPLNPADSLQLKIRSIPDSNLNKLLQDDAFWYANAAFEKKKIRPESGMNYTPLTQRPWFKSLLWIVIVVVFAAVIMFYLADSNFGLFRKNKKVVQRTEAGKNEMPEDIFAIDYQLELERAVALSDFRLAVRLKYLRLLKNMTEKNLIRYQQDKTNMDYLMQLFNTGYYHDFFRITRHYEYSWYGHFTVSAEAYRLISQDVEQFEKRS